MSKFADSGESFARFLLIIFEAALKICSAGADVACMCSMFLQDSKYQDTLLNLPRTVFLVKKFFQI